MKRQKCSTITSSQGLTFKENCIGLRNTRVVDVVKELRDYGCLVDGTTHGPRRTRRAINTGWT